LVIPLYEKLTFEDVKKVAITMKKIVLGA